MLILIENVLEIGADPNFNIGRDLDKILAVDDTAKLIIQVLIRALDHSALHALEFFPIERHALPRAVLCYLVLD